MNRGKRSVYSAATAITLTILNGLLGLIVTRLIITNYGSDFNGINSTANQLINMLLIVEGGFTLAINVALFKPLAEHDYNAVNGIMAATKKIFIKIGSVFLALGVLASIGYSMMIKSGLPIEIAILTFMMTVIATSFNLLYASKYSILLQTEQREYILNAIKIGTIVLSQLSIIAVISFQGHVLLVRFSTMVGAIINSLAIVYLCKRRYKHLDFKETPNFSMIKGTKDVFAQKITSVIYSTLPIMFIAVTVGTIFASVYAVYNLVFTLINSVLYSLINAPRMGLGQLIAEKDKHYVLGIFSQYEYIVINAMLSFLTTTAVLIMPFISIYTVGIADIDYKNWNIAIILLLITFFEIIHIPSGNIINVSGNFKIGKNFQNIAAITLVVVMLIGSRVDGFFGILVAVLIAAILLAVLEIGYIHHVYFGNSILAFLRILVPNMILSIILICAEITMLPSLENYFQFMLAGCVLVAVNSTLILLFNLIVNKSLTIKVLHRGFPLTKQFLKARLDTP